MTIHIENNIDYQYVEKDKCIKYFYKNWGSQQPQNGQAAIYLSDLSTESIVAALNEAYQIGRKDGIRDLHQFLEYPR